MKKIIAGLTLGIATMCIGTMGLAHVDITKGQAIESLKARISLLQAKLASLTAEETQLESTIGTLKQNKKNVRQLSLLASRLSVVKEERSKLIEALRVSNTSLKPLITIK